MPFLGVQVAAVTTGANIVDGSIQSDDIANGAITAAKIASGAVPTGLTVTKRDATTSSVSITNGSFTVVKRDLTTANVSVS